MTSRGVDSDAAQGESRNARFNRRVLVGDVTCFFIGVAFLDAASVLPPLVARLGEGTAGLALMATLRQAGYFLPQLFVAHRIRGRARNKPFLLRACGFGRVWLFVAALTIWRYGRTDPRLAFAVLCVAYALAWLGDGMGSVPWTAIVGKAIPLSERGRLFASTQMLGGIGRLASGVVVAAILSGSLLAFPASSAVIVLGAAVSLACSWVFLALIREPSTVPRPEPRIEEGAESGLSFAGYLLTMPARFRERPVVGRLALIQVLVGAAAAAAPFLWGQAGRFTSGGLSTAMSGGFLIVQTCGLLTIAPLLGHITDRHGAFRTLRVLVPLTLCSQLVPMAAAVVPGGRDLHLALFGGAYFLLGGTADAWATITNCLLETVPEPHEQATYIAALNSSTAPVLILPLLLGRLVRVDGDATAAFAVAAVLIVVALFVTVTASSGGRTAGRY